MEEQSETHTKKSSDSVQEPVEELVQEPQQQQPPESVWQRTLAKFKSHDKLIQDKNRQLTNELNNIEEKNANLFKEVGDLNFRLESELANGREKDEQIKALRKENNKLEDVIKTQSKDFERKKLEEIQTWKSQLETFEREKNKEIDEAKKTIIEFENRLAATEQVCLEEISSREETSREAQKAVGIKEKAIDAIELKAGETILDLQNRLKATEKLYSDAQTNIKAKREAIASLEQKFLKAQKEIDSKVTAIGLLEAEAQENYKRMNKQLDDLKKVKQMYDEGEKTIEIKQNMIDWLESEKKAQEERGKVSEKNVLEAKDIIDEKDQKIALLNAEVKNYKKKFENSELQLVTERAYLLKISNNNEKLQEKIHDLNNEFEKIELQNSSLLREIGRLNFQLESQTAVTLKLRMEIQKLNAGDLKEEINKSHRVNERYMIKNLNLREHNEELEAQLKMREKELNDIRENNLQMSNRDEIDICGLNAELDELRSENIRLNAIIDTAANENQKKKEQRTDGDGKISELMHQLECEGAVKDKLVMDNQMLLAEYQDCQERLVEEKKLCEERIKEQRLELEGKLEKMKQKMTKYGGGPSIISSIYFIFGYLSIILIIGVVILAGIFYYMGLSAEFNFKY